MSAYIKLSNFTYPHHIGDIELDPLGMADYANVQWREQPNFDKKTQRCYEVSPVLENGVWQTVWAVRDMTQQEIDYQDKKLELLKPPTLPFF